NWIKGVYDSEHKERRFLVTGSARLDVYRRGGDSLLGRYHYWRLHPFDLSEIPAGISPPEAFKRLMTVGGFPEPFLDNNEQEARRWRKERFDRILKDDIRDLEPLRDLSTLNLFVDALRRRVGQLIVLDNIVDELQVSHKTLKHWLEVLERMYVVFVVRPWTKKIPRAIQKPPKVYFFDNADVLGDEGSRFENLVATSLLKHCHFIEDSQGHACELRYIRDKEKREVDFCLIKDGKIETLIEAKYAEESFANGLAYYAERFQPQQALQIVATLKKPKTKGRLRMESPLEALCQSPFK
ncbi:MAG: ATP-binding protein, partial [Deltaproteobacteria bacterium]|nr:ATP-binding protein [Deltaproteobacteria bacterium]